MDIGRWKRWFLERQRCGEDAYRCSLSPALVVPYWLSMITAAYNRFYNRSRHYIVDDTTSSIARRQTSTTTRRRARGTFRPTHLAVLRVSRHHRYHVSTTLVSVRSSFHGIPPPVRVRLHLPPSGFPRCPFAHHAPPSGRGAKCLLVPNPVPPQAKTSPPHHRQRRSRPRAKSRGPRLPATSTYP